MAETLSSITISTQLERIAQGTVKPCAEEPDAGNLYVRIRGGLRGAIPRGYPTAWLPR